MNYRSTPIPLFVLALAFCSFTLLGCGEAKEEPAASTTTSLPDNLFITTAPEGAVSIKELKASAKEGDEVVVEVIVGGSGDPIVDGRASASIVDASLYNKCLSGDDHCAEPWDYCCAPKEDLKASMANLQVVDADGRALTAQLSDKIKPLSKLMVRGVVGPRLDPQALTINATAIYIQPDTP